MSSPQLDRPISVSTLEQAQQPATSFVVQRNGSLMLEDGTPFNFASMNAPELLDGHDFETEDTMRTLAGFGRRITRTYTLKIKGTSPYLQGPGHINGWDEQAGDWIYDEDMFVKIDKVIASAAKYGVRLVIPAFDNDFGSDQTNWVGNYIDLIIHRKGLAIDYDRARKAVDFFEDPEMIEATKLIYAKLLNRVNTSTGIRYGDDPTIAAWETGNELQHIYKGKLPAPGRWTVEMAKHIKSLAPRTLVIDGSFAKADSVEASYAEEAFKSEYIDILSYHFYYASSLKRFPHDIAMARKHGKAFFAGEYGFFECAEDYERFLRIAKAEGCAGSMVWSLRPHAEEGGFKVHSEMDNNFSYHAPGWPSATTKDNFELPHQWDTKEHHVVNAVREASFGINDEALPKHFPNPNSPKLWSNSDRSICWQGSAWAETYEVWLSTKQSPCEYSCIAQGVLDAVPAGHLKYELGDNYEAGGIVRIRGIGPNGEKGGWSNAVTM